MKSIYFIMAIICFVSCETKPGEYTSNTESDTDIFGNQVDTNSIRDAYLMDSSDLFIKDFFHEHLKKTLFIDNQEQYTFNLYKEHLNNDTIEDAIITLNRLALAKAKAKGSGKPWKDEEIGFMGPYNAFFYFDGKTNMISPPIIVYSSPLVDLKVSFDNITSIDYKDILIDYRIRNSSYKDVYFLINNFPELVFEWKIFDGLGTSNEEAYSFSFESDKGKTIKNILITESTIGSIPKNSNLFTYQPKLIQTNKKVKEFFYLESKRKYFTLNED